ncbi:MULTISPECIES: hypothetical protein [Streptomyces]|uniref:Uncharacterized protein n=1 Tax=Streptomyces virginiae TaxID=1961 RepID=A0ABZ1T688_STRVG|nr:hypothetical protein [Streptomyces virginiae]WTB20192.1 hypothetical protein OG253_00935 [Streptomyces virginiae]
MSVVFVTDATHQPALERQLAETEALIVTGRPSPPFRRNAASSAETASPT